MGQTLATYDARVRARLGNIDSTAIPDGDLDKYVEDAVRRFSRDRPRILTADYAGDGVTTDFALPAGWLDDFSFVAAIESPQGQKPAAMLDDAEISLYPDRSTPQFIRLASTIPSAGQTARIYFATSWPIPDAVAGTDQISAVDFEAVVALAASYAAEELRARSIRNTRSDFPEADQAGRVTEETDKWQMLARDLRREYADHLGTLADGSDATGPGPAGATYDWDARATFDENGREFLFHGGRR